MNKYYRVIKDTFLWEEGAILCDIENTMGYRPISDVWNKFTEQNEYITKKLIENNPEWFERVYESNFEKAVFVTKEQYKKMMEKFTA